MARTFVTQAKILFADVLTGILDAATDAQIIEFMPELNCVQGTALILVTHDEALVQRYGKKLRLTAGRVM